LTIIVLPIYIYGETDNRKENMVNKNKKGRPFAEVTKSERIQVKVTKEQKKKIQELAEKKGVNVSELILTALGL